MSYPQGFLVLHFLRSLKITIEFVFNFKIEGKKKELVAQGLRPVGKLPCCDREQHLLARLNIATPHKLLASVPHQCHRFQLFCQFARPSVTFARDTPR
jgi:hypothetical protein